jgi:hypothetical protein
MNAMFLESSKHSQSTIMHNIQSWRKSKRKSTILKNDLCTPTIKSGFNLQEEIKTFGAMTLILALEKEEPLRCISCTMIQPPSCTPSRPPKCELQIGHLGDDVRSMGGHKFR